MAHLKISVLGLSLQTHHRTTVAFVLIRTVYPLMKKRWKRNVKADTILDMYQVCEQHLEASFGFSPMSSSCPAQHGSHPSDTTCTQLCHSHHILTEASCIFRNWVLSCISMDLPLSAILASSDKRRNIFWDVFNCFHVSLWILQSGAALHIFCVQAMTNSSRDRSADTEITYGHLEIWHHHCLLKLLRLLPVSGQRISDMTFKRHKREALNYNVLLTELKQSDSP